MERSNIGQKLRAAKERATAKQLAERALAKVKAQRKGKKFKLIQIDSKTWKEVEVKDE